MTGPLVCSPGSLGIFFGAASSRGKAVLSWSVSVCGFVVIPMNPVRSFFLWRPPPLAMIALIFWSGFFSLPPSLFSPPGGFISSLTRRGGGMERRRRSFQRGPFPMVNLLSPPTPDRQLALDREVPAVISIFLYLARPPPPLNSVQFSASFQCASRLILVM